MYLDYLLLPAVFLLGLITSYQDHKERKIKNKWVLSAFFWGVFVHIFVLLIYIFKPELITLFVFEEMALSLPTYVFRVVVNSSIALVFGYLLWYFNLWAAGDAKLFFSFSLLLPLTHYWKTVFPVFPSFVLLINIFTLLILFLAFQGLINLIRGSMTLGELKDKIIKNKKEHLKNAQELGSFLLFFILVRILLIQLEINFFNTSKRQVLLIISTFILHALLSKIVDKKSILKGSVLGILVYLLGDYLSYCKSITSEVMNIGKNMFIFTVFFSLVKGLISFEKSKEKERYMPFAYFAFLGVILTILAKGSVVSILMSFLV